MLIPSSVLVELVQTLWTRASNAPTEAGRLAYWSAAAEVRAAHERVTGQPMDVKESLQRLVK